ncbi:VOC family protein [Fulvivirga sp. RKSG066]|uniref:VOC family protein n=1 Tax=Fulvivirga aurantia TaxID=2529383 RepID=UPI0012BD4D11|nr:VOC family protein [Fulvivirga aurantia]MTI22356.1 VOC family protein [Fulvivirga aurantia]
MHKLYKTHLPEACSTVNTYLFVEKPEEYIKFLVDGLFAEEVGRMTDEKSGEIQNAQIQIGHSRIMISQARGQFLGMKTSMYLYTNDVDHLYENAIKRGAKGEFEPADMDYGDRQAGIKDPAGNYWWISKRLETKEYY